MIPSTWVLAAKVVAAIGAVALAWAGYNFIYQKGWDARQAQATREALRAAELSDQKRIELEEQLATLAAETHKERQDAEQKATRLSRELAAGRLRFAVPVTSSQCPSASAASASEPARAELDPETARDVFDIAVEGDTAIRDLNECIARYNQVMETINAD